SNVRGAGAVIGRFHYDNVLKKFVDGTKLQDEQKEKAEALQAMGALGTLELGLLAERINQEKKQAELIAALGEPLRDAYGKGLRASFGGAGKKEQRAIFEALQTWVPGQLDAFLDEQRGRGKALANLGDKAGAAIGGLHYDTLLKKFVDGTVVDDQDKREAETGLAR